MLEKNFNLNIAKTNTYLNNNILVLHSLKDRYINRLKLIYTSTL